MKRAFYLNLLVAGLVLTLGGVGCQKKPKNPTPIPGAQTKVRTPDGGFGVEQPGPRVPPDTGTTDRTIPPGTGPGTPSGIPLPLDIDTGMRRDETIFKANTVYFDFDRSSIKSGERSKIEAVANHLKGQPTQKLKVEGHCDERGTEGYNMALGERRALAIREYLVNLGIAPDRVYTVTWGESHPVDPGHDDAAWAKNRRGEFVLLLPP